MENLEAVREAFSALNSFKRSRTLSEKAQYLGYENDENFHKLQMFKDIDRVELALRTINKNERLKQDERSTKDARQVATSKTEGGDADD